jgi:hypothetical protein
MRSTDLEFAQAWTRKPEALGVVLNNGIVLTSPARFLEGPLHPHPSRGRKKVHAAGYARLKAHRRRKSGIRMRITDDNEIGL